MRKLIKYRLNFEKTYDYFHRNLDRTNTLSSELLGLIDFKNGYFFTLLPSETDPDKLHSFEFGGIIIQEPLKTHIIDGQESYYSIVRTVRNEVSELILKELKTHPGIFCIFDDILSSPSDNEPGDLFDTHGINYENEVYYLVQKEGASIDLIKKCFQYSNNGWHSLCVLTEANFNNENIKMLSLNKMREVALKAKLIIIRAYDGEGYVFWELN